MNPAHPALAMNALQFSGAVTAAFSHDFKNVLAIIKENNGLLKDLLAMTEHGRPLDPERLAVLAERIGRQVERADRMAIQLNRFAHSADLPEVETDLTAMIELAVVLAGRPAGLKRVALEVVPPAASLWVTTFPFALQQLFYRCIEPLLDIAGSGGRILLAAQGGRDSVRVQLIGRSAEGQIVSADAARLPTPEMSHLAEALKIRLDWDAPDGGWHLTWHADRPQTGKKP